MPIKITQAGLSTTVQDLGRPGYYHLGLPISGAMDRYSMIAANLLVGNSENDAVLEAVFIGPTIEFTEDAVVAVTGASIPPKVDGKVMPNWCSFKVLRGQTLSFDYLKYGARIYIAIGGGISVPLKLGSRSTYTLGALGGHQGRALATGDTLPIGTPNKQVKDGRELPESLHGDAILTQNKTVELRMIPDIYWHRLTEASQHKFLADTWKVAPEADRIGYRFRGGTALNFVERKQPFGAGSDPSNIVDGCYPYGSIQVPGGTEPIVLHRDAVSGGGYFMVGAVISADMDVIGQMQPNIKARFVAVNMEQALKLRNEKRSKLDKARSACK